MNEQLDALREQLEFERYWREWRDARILAVARKEPSLTCTELGERFGMTDNGISKLLIRYGERRELSDMRGGDYRQSGLRKRRVA